ncbi:MAG: HlyD family efflux transporter periplasmic adaptor subunit [Lachnospiraceae bacterium]|nr:HlyD family efflux transporter periplasmic adaptor subunit [Lachnospiraceae bacterium]
MSKKKKRKLILIIAALTVLVGAACYTVFIAPLLKKDEWIYKEASVERGTLTVGVTESGSLEFGITSINYDLDLTVTSSNDDEEDDDDDEETTTRYLTINEVYAATGQRINEGDALMSFTEDSIKSVRKLLENALVQAKADYNDAESEYQLAVLEADTDYSKAQISSSYASAIYKNSGTALGNEIKSLQIQIQQCENKTASLDEAITEAQEKYNEALTSYNETKAAYEAVANSTDVYTIAKDYQTLYLNAINSYQSAMTALQNAQTAKTENESKIADLKSQLSLARTQYTVNSLAVEETYAETTLKGTNAEITYNATLESLKEDLAEAEDDLKNIQNQLDAFEAFVGEDGVLYAGGSGIVTESPYSAGDELTANGVLISYAAPGDMTISVDVEQEDIVTLSVGDEVEIEFTAYEGEKYTGTIISIDTTATSEDSKTVSYSVVIGVKGDTSKLYGGMVADVTFVTEEKEDVLFVSRNAIVNEGSKTYVYHDNAFGKMELTEVTTGIGNGTSVEITSGLADGEMIYIASKVSSESEVKSEEVADTTDATDNNTDSNAPGDFGGDFSFPDGEMPSNMPGDMPGGFPGGSGNGSGGGFPGGMSGGPFGGQ